MKTVRIPKLHELSDDARHRLEAVRREYGEIPENALLMSCIPGLAESLQDLTRVCVGQGALPTPLKWLAGHMASRVAGCQFCSAHTAHNAANLAGVAPEKFAAIWEFESSPLYEEAERAVLRFAAAAGSVPNQVEEAHYDALREYFDDHQILELVAVIAFFGFLNRWNDTLGTRLGDEPMEFALQHLTASGWNADRHGG